MTASLFCNSAVASVVVRLGATAFTRTPRAAYSRASDRVRFENAPLAALYPLPHQSPPRPEADDTLTIEPWFSEGVAAPRV
jgi:hypothetical protein